MKFPSVESKTGRRINRSVLYPIIAAVTGLSVAALSQIEHTMLAKKPETTHTKKSAAPQIPADNDVPVTPSALVTPLAPEVVEAVPETIDLNELKHHEDLLPALLKGGTVLARGKYFRIHREPSGAFSLAIGFGWDKHMEDGQLYEFTDPAWQKALHTHMTGESTSVKISYRSEMELAKKLNVAGATEQSTLSLHISVDSLVMKTLGYDQLIIPLREAESYLNPLASYRVPGDENVDIDFSFLIANGDRYGQMMKLRCIGEYDHKARKKLEPKKAKTP